MMKTTMIQSMMRNSDDMRIFPYMSKQEIRDALIAMSTDDIINTESTEAAIWLMDDAFNDDTDVSMTLLNDGKVSLTWFGDDSTDYIVCSKDLFDCYHISQGEDSSVIIGDAELGDAERFIFDYITR